jgi:hypothetical protein
MASNCDQCAKWAKEGTPLCFGCKTAFAGKEELLTAMYVKLGLNPQRGIPATEDVFGLLKTVWFSSLAAPVTKSDLISSANANPQQTLENAWLTMMGDKTKLTQLMLVVKTAGDTILRLHRERNEARVECDKARAQLEEASSVFLPVLSDADTPLRHQRELKLSKRFEKQKSGPVAMEKRKAQFLQLKSDILSLEGNLELTVKSQQQKLKELYIDKEIYEEKLEQDMHLNSISPELLEAMQAKAELEQKQKEMESKIALLQFENKVQQLNPAKAKKAAAKKPAEKKAVAPVSNLVAFDAQPMAPKKSAGKKSAPKAESKAPVKIELVDDDDEEDGYAKVSSSSALVSVNNSLSKMNIS